MSKLVVTDQVMEAIRQHAEETYPHECCGLFVGRLEDDGTRRVVRAERARNTNVERAHDRFELHPEDFLRIDEQARREGLEVIGCYHSHPDHPARPSAYDAERAFPAFSYMIVSVEKGRLTAARSWQFDDVKGQFDEEPVEQVAASEATTAGAEAAADAGSRAEERTASY